MQIHSNSDHSLIAECIPGCKSVQVMSCSTFCTVVFSLSDLIVSLHTATDNAPLGVGTFFGGVVAGVVSVVLFEVCVLGVVKWRQRMKEPAASKEKEDVRFASIILIMQGNVQLLHGIKFN